MGCENKSGVKYEAKVFGLSNKDGFSIHRYGAWTGRSRVQFWMFPVPSGRLCGAVSRQRDVTRVWS